MQQHTASTAVLFGLSPSGASRPADDHQGPPVFRFCRRCCWHRCRACCADARCSHPAWRNGSGPSGARRPTASADESCPSMGSRQSAGRRHPAGERGVWETLYIRESPLAWDEVALEFMVLIILLQAAQPYISDAASMQHVLFHEVQERQACGDVMQCLLTCPPFSQPFLCVQPCEQPSEQCEHSAVTHIVTQCLLAFQLFACPFTCCLCPGALVADNHDFHSLLSAQVLPPMPCPSSLPCRPCPPSAGLSLSFALIPSLQACFNPWCATRVGEARVPGPPVAKRPSQQSPLRESRRRIRSKGPPPQPSTTLASVIPTPIRCCLSTPLTRHTSSSGATTSTQTPAGGGKPAVGVLYSAGVPEKTQ